ncbi:Uncharacterised protein [Vibrio cholerae]|uniref:Uncharacterized protein n=1 Tax=Vibrio cholerae TaxID=666 RepID=A0A656A0X2_VIBCL|nr:Uncharacterised protein [Vibrio cholerae]CSC87130.1 Uncharacterised protein [Vibrio cholerae]
MRFNVGTQLINQRFTCCHAIFTILVLPETAMVVVGVQNSEFVGFVCFPLLSGCSCTTCQRGNNGCTEDGF